MVNTLTMRRLSVVALAPRDHPEPEELRSRLDDTVCQLLPEALAEAISDWSGDGILRIRRLEVDLTVNAALTPKQLTKQLALAIADGLQRARADGRRVLSFADRSQYLAAFLRDLAAGCAWQRWWFQSFDGLKALPVSAAIRTAALANPVEGLGALLTMPREALAGVLAKLGTADCARVLDGLATLGEIGVPLERIVAALTSTNADAVFAPASALTLFLDAVRTDRSCAGPQLARLATALDALHRILGAQRAAPAAEILHMLDGDTAFAGGASGAASIAPLLVLPPEMQRALATVAAARRGIAPTKTVAANRQYTPFGGLFMLLPSLDLNAIKNATDDMPAPGDLALAPLLGLLTLAACAGRRQIADVLSDPVWKEVFALPMALGAADAAAALASIAPAWWPTLEPLGMPITTRSSARFLLAPSAIVGSRAAARAIARLAQATSSRFARRLPGFASSSASFLYRNLLAVGATVEKNIDGISVVLDRAPLDVLLSISGVADADVVGPDGSKIRMRRRRLT